MRVKVETYGCTRNRADGAIMEGLLESAGYEVSEDGEIVVLNTCAVKGRTINRMRSRISDLVEEKRIVIVAGCLPSINMDAIDDRVDGIIDVNNLNKVVEVLEEIESSDDIGVVRYLDDNRVSSDSICKLDFSRDHTVGSTAVVPIGEGCLGSCTFCATKFARGTLRSYDPDKIFGKVSKLVNSGYKEIQLTSEDTGAYGKDIGRNLPDLLSDLVGIEGNFRIRVGMMNPDQVLPFLDELIEVFKSSKIYNFLHLPLQSGDDDTLGSMRRKYSVNEFKEIVSAFREGLNDLYLSTDVIVGYPTETEDDFERTVEVLKEIKPNNVNVSKFFPHKGTDAYQLDNRVPSEITKGRSKKLADLRMQISEENNKKYLGDVKEILVTKEGKKGKGNYIGRLNNYTPVIVKDNRIGEFIEREIKEAKSTYIKTF